MPNLIWTNVPAWFIIAPLLFLHANNYFPKNKSDKKWTKVIHFIPALCIIFYMLPFYILEGKEKIEIYESFYTEKKFDYVQVVYLSQIALYAVGGSKYIKRKLIIIQDQISNSTLIHVVIIKKIFYVLTTYIVVAIIVSIFIQYFIDTIFAIYSMAFFTLSCVITVSTIYFFNSNLEVQKSIPDASIDMALPAKRRGKYASSPLSEENMNTILLQIDKIMKEKELYRNSNLKITDVSKLTDIPGHHISQSLNQKREKNFFEYVNDFRVNAVIQQLEQHRNQSLTLAAIALECGFRSQSSFYRIFKNLTGKTPNSFIKD